MRKFICSFRLLFATLLVMLFTAIPMNAKTLKDPLANMSALLDSKKPNKDKFLDPAQAEKDAIKKWDAEVMRSLVAATTTEAVFNALKLARKDSAEMTFGLQKWDAISRGDLEKAVSLNDVLDVCKNIRVGSDVEPLGLARVDELCLDSVKKANSVEALLSARFRPNSEAHALWQEKMVVFSAQAMRDATSIEDAWAAYQRGPQDEAAQKLWVETHDKLSMKEVKEAKTLEALQVAFVRARRGSSAQNEAVIKAAKFLPLQK